MTDIERRLAALNIVLPEAALPAANYLPYVVSGNHLYLSGQLPAHEGRFACVGKLGDTLTIEDGYAGARLCAINLVAQMKAALVICHGCGASSASAASSTARPPSSTSPR